MLSILRKPKSSSIIDYEIRKRFIELAIWILLILILHSLTIKIFEGISLLDSMWLSFTTITTVGYGDFVPKTFFGRLSTVLIIYVGGIFALARLVGSYFDYKSWKEYRIKAGLWRWKMKDHIVILNIPHKKEEWFFTKLAKELKSRKNELHDKKLLIISEHFCDKFPIELAEVGYYYQNASPNDEQALIDANIKDASHVIVLSNSIVHHTIADAQAFDLVHRIRNMNKTANIIVEAIEDQNRKRLLSVGASFVIRPNRVYPEMLARAIIAPGVENILERIFTSGGDECIRYDVKIDSITWGEVIKKSENSGLGLPLACLSDGEIKINPDHDKIIKCDAIYLLTTDDKIVSDNKAKEVFII